MIGQPESLVALHCRLAHDDVDRISRKLQRVAMEGPRCDAQRVGWLEQGIELALRDMQWLKDRLTAIQETELE